MNANSTSSVEIGMMVLIPQGAGDGFKLTRKRRRL